MKRISMMVDKMEADAWIVLAGSREVLEWFARQKMPGFALFGRWRQFGMAAAGPDKPPVYGEVVRHLAALGHRRIVLMTRRLRRLPAGCRR